MRRPRALTLDLDDTLLDGAGLHESIARVCAHLAGEYPLLDAAELRAANAAAWMEYWHVVEDDWTLGRLDSATFSLEGWRRTLLACGCDVEAVAWAARDLHRQFAREAHRLYDDVHELFEFLDELELPVALVTNGASDVQREKLEVLGIEGRFVAVVVSGELGAAKPHALPFETAVAALGTEPGDTWHVGDNLAKDVAGALGAGLVAVWLNRSGLAPDDDAPRPDLEVRSMHELLAVVRATEPVAS